MNQNIQFYTSAKDNKGRLITVQAAIDMIMGQSVQGKGLILPTREFRALEPGKVKDEIKKTFPAVAWSGTFTKRAATSLDQHSGLICIDVDKLKEDQLGDLRGLLLQNKSVFFFFISPSGNGKKILFKIDVSGAGTNKEIQQLHLNYFNALQAYFQQHYGIAIDNSGKDVSRLCFLCNDTAAYTNPNSTVLGAEFLQQYAPQATPPKKETYNTKQQTQLTNAADINAVWEFTQEMHSFSDGSRNTCMYKFGVNCALRGYTIEDALLFGLEWRLPDFDSEEITTCIKSAYKKINSDGEFGKYLKKHPGKNENTHPKKHQEGFSNGHAEGHGGNATTQQTNSGSIPGRNERYSRQDQHAANEIAEVEFWYFPVNEKTGKVSDRPSINYRRFYQFLENHGFFNLRMDQQSVELIKVQDNVVSPVIINKFRNDVKVYMNEWCEENGEYHVLEMLHRGEDKYFNRTKFINLRYKKIEFLKDTSTTSHYFHRNGVVTVTKEGIKFRQYEAGEKCLWESQIIDRDFTPIPHEQPLTKEGRIDYKQIPCEFARYQALAASNPTREDVDPKTYNHRIYAHMTAFGYLVNGYKHGTEPAIVAVDHQKAMDRTEQNGRTGKGLFAKALGHIKKRYNVDGRRFKPEDATVFEGVTMDVKIITVCDCSPNVDFGFFFNMITDDFTFRKLYIGPVTIPYKDSPKLYLDTNFSFKGDGASFRGRQHIIEFDNYFNEGFKPEHEFGHLFFGSDWDDAQWNLFYNYAYECDRLYKQMGLVEYPGGNYYERKLMSECPEEFIDWADRCDNGNYVNLPRNKKQVKKELFMQWCEVAKEWQLGNQTSHRFKKMVTQYCKTKGLTLISTKPGGTEFYLIEDKNDPHYQMQGTLL